MKIHTFETCRHRGRIESLVKITSRRDFISSPGYRKREKYANVMASTLALRTEAITATSSLYAQEARRERFDDVTFNLNGQAFAGWQWQFPFTDGDEVEVIARQRQDNNALEVLSVRRLSDERVSIYPRCTCGRKAYRRIWLKTWLWATALIWIAMVAMMLGMALASSRGVEQELIWVLLTMLPVLLVVLGGLGLRISHGVGREISVAESIFRGYGWPNVADINLRATTKANQPTWEEVAPSRHLFRYYPAPNPLTAASSGNAEPAGQDNQYARLIGERVETPHEALLRQDGDGTTGAACCVCLGLAALLFASAFDTAGLWLAFIGVITCLYGIWRIITRRRSAQQPQPRRIRSIAGVVRPLRGDDQISAKEEFTVGSLAVRYPYFWGAALRNNLDDKVHRIEIDDNNNVVGHDALNLYEQGRRFPYTPGDYKAVFLFAGTGLLIASFFMSAPVTMVWNLLLGGLGHHAPASLFRTLTPPAVLLVSLGFIVSGVRHVRTCRRSGGIKNGRLENYIAERLNGCSSQQSISPSTPSVSPTGKS